MVLGPLVGLVLWRSAYRYFNRRYAGTGVDGWLRWREAQPPNVIIGTIVGTAFAGYYWREKPDVAAGVAVPSLLQHRWGRFLVMSA